MDHLCDDTAPYETGLRRRSPGRFQSVRDRASSVAGETRPEERERARADTQNHGPRSRLYEMPRAGRMCPRGMMGIAIQRLLKEEQDALALPWREVIVQCKPLASVGPRRWPQSCLQPQGLPRLTRPTANDSPCPGALSQLRPHNYPVVSTRMALNGMSRD